MTDARLLTAACVVTAALTGVGQEWSELTAMAVASAMSAVVLLRNTSRLGARASLAAGLLAAPAAIGCIQLLTNASADSSATEIQVARWLSAAVFALAVGRCREHQGLLNGLTAIGAAVTTIAGIYRLAVPGGEWPFANRNHLASFCLLLLPLALSGGTRALPQEPAWRTGAAIVLALGGTLAGSRAGLALTLVEGLALLLFLNPHRSASRSPRRMALVAAGAGVCALFFAWLIWPLGHPRDAPWLLYRDQIWAASRELFLEKPWAGHGLGSFRTVYPSQARFDTGEVVHRAHNDWLEWIVEGGVIAPVPLLLIGVGACLRLRRKPWLLGLPMVLLHSLVDYPLDRFILLLLLAALAPAALAATDRTPGSQRHLRARKKLRSAPISELESFPASALQ